MKNDESRKTTEFWPRVGYALLPLVYREAWIDEPLPSAVLRRLGLPTRVTLGELDRTLWDRVQSLQVVQLLANHILSLITKRLYFGADFRVVRLPILGYGLPTILSGYPMCPRLTSLLFQMSALEPSLISRLL